MFLGLQQYATYIEMSMSIYGITILPLIRHLDGLCRQLVFADDVSAGGRVGC